MAQTVANDMVKDKEKALKAAQNAKSKGGAIIAEKIASEQERKANIQNAEQELAIWQAIASVPEARQQAMAEAQTQAEAEQNAYGREETVGLPVALEYLLEGGKGSIENAGYFLYGVQAAFPHIAAELQRVRDSIPSELLGMTPDLFVASNPHQLQEMRNFVAQSYGDKGVELFDKLTTNSTGFIPREGKKVGLELENLTPVEAPLVEAAEEVDDTPSLLDVVRTLYSKGKDVASRLFSMKFFDVAQTPKFMQELGLRGDKFTIKYGVIARHLGKDISHTLTERDWEQLPQALQNPFAISKLTDKTDSYRIYTTLQTESGEFVVVGADVKNAGREIEVNAVSTVFGRRNNANLPKNEAVIYRSKEITPEQSSLLERPNFAQYPTEQELSNSKDTTSSQNNNEIEDKNVQEAEELEASDIAPYTISPAEYTTKKGKVLDMHLVRFAGALTKEQQRAAKELAKANKGWYDREQGGFMMRSEESAKQLADTILNNDDAVDDAQPVSLSDTREVVEEYKPNEEPTTGANQGQFGLVSDERMAERQRRLMAQKVQEIAQKLKLDNVEIVTDASTLSGKRAKAKGYFNPTTGKIVIVIPNHASVLDVEETVLHEAVAHYGLRKLFGKHFDTFLDNVYESADPEIHKKIAALAAKNGWDFRKATEEYLAMLAEDTEFESVTYGGWWFKVKELFRKMLNKLGLEDFAKEGLTLSDNELRYILFRSYQHLQGQRGLMFEAEDAVKQYELGVGNYSTPKVADKLNVGGKLVINVRSAESIKNQGIEGKTRITLDDESEILVLRPNGNIKAYQKGFTKQELKSWCEKELGNGFKVEIANKNNAGGSYDTAVVITKNNESTTVKGNASESGQPASKNRSASLTNLNAKLDKNAERAKRLDAIISSINEIGAMGAHEFLHELIVAMTLNNELSTEKSRYAKLEGGITLRLADHYANASTFKVNNEFKNNYGLVIKLRNKAFVHDNDVDYLEYIYYPDKLSNKRQIEIANGLKAFITTGLYNYLPTPDNIHPSGKFKDAIDEMSRSGEGAVSDEGVTMASDPVSKAIGEPRYGRGKKMREYAERQRRLMVQKVQEIAQKLKLDNVEIVTDASTLSGRAVILNTQH